MEYSDAVQLMKEVNAPVVKAAITHTERHIYAIASIGGASINLMDTPMFDPQQRTHLKSHVATNPHGVNDVNCDYIIAKVAEHFRSKSYYVSGTKISWATP